MADTDIKNCPILNSDDYTFYIERDTKAAIADPIEAAAMALGEAEDQFSYDFAAGLSGACSSAGVTSGISINRLLAARCFRGRAWSITVRSRSKDRIEATEPELWGVKPWDPSAYAAGAGYKDVLFSIRDVREALFGLLLPNPEQHPSGLVVVTGATGSAKSQIVMSLIHEYLSRGGPWKRKPHLLTIEDPIEDWFWKESAENSLQRAFLPPDTRPIDVTPRQLRIDTPNLKSALKDALRQTPAVVYVSEVREKEDWLELMSFAGTGHLALTTAHAGSLTEAMHKILRATDAKTPSDRAEIAQRIIGLIHIRREVVDGLGALLPALWRRQGSGVQSFISDGLSAILPGHPGKENREASTFGRLWFVKQMLQPSTDPAVESARQARTAELVSLARRLDLDGK